MSQYSNLFYYGKKELTQDSVLMWLLKNYQNDDFKEISRNILGWFALGRPLRDDESISELRGKQQNKDIDVALEFLLKSPDKTEWFFLIIEDKTYSYIHSKQIKKYLLSIFAEKESQWQKDNRKNIHIRMIYFKSMSLNPYDKYEPEIEAREAEKEFPVRTNSVFNSSKDVVVVDLKDFNEKIISRHIETTNPLLREYCNYMKDRYDALSFNNADSRDLSEYFIGYPNVWEDNKNERTIERSNIFFDSLFEEFIERKGNSEYWWCQFDYFFFKHFDDKTDNQKFPIIEMRSRDFEVNKGVCFIQVHLVNYSSYLENEYKTEKEYYLKKTRFWANYLSEKYESQDILPGFSYSPSNRTKDQKQLGTITYRKEGPITHSDLLQIFDQLMNIQEMIDRELENIGQKDRDPWG